MTQMTKERRTQTGSSLFHLTFQEPSRVIRVRVSPPESDMVIKSQLETIRVTQSPQVSTANVVND